MLQSSKRPEFKSHKNHTSATLLAYVAGGIAMIAVALYLKMLDF